ncbi:MAG: murein biosynthesis integral membrane protein MurJ, partial [Planctomycetota bacterium]|nr:murein biosynthesis integral membrane protein MurJ [Planctomycetota bacterium]
MRSVISSASVISACIFLSRVLGFLRDVLCSGFFGPVWDAFIFAFTIPNLFRRLFGEGALSSAFIPTLSNYLNNKERSETLRFINIIITLLFGFLCLIAGGVIIFTFIIPIIFPTSTASEKILSPLFLKLLRIMIPYLPLICLVALLQAILNSLKHFLAPALASVVLNICWIGGFIVAHLVNTADENYKVMIIAWAILIGGVMEVIIQLPALVKNKITYKPQISFNHPGLKEVLRLMLPTVFGLAVFQINLICDYLIAVIFVPESGAISALYYGNRMMQFPFALIGISLATAVFPYLADYIARNDINGMLAEYQKALKAALFVGIPASVGLIVLSEPIIRWAFYSIPSSLFQIKAFTPEAINRTSNVLLCYSIGIWAYGAVQITNRAFYALKDMTTPVRIGVFTVLINITLNLILVFPLKEAGISLATTISSVLNMVILLIVLGRRSGNINLLSCLVKALIKPLLCGLLMGVVCYLGLLYLPRYLPPITTVLAETIFLIGLVALGIVSYLAISRGIKRNH